VHGADESRQVGVADGSEPSGENVHLNAACAAESPPSDCQFVDEHLLGDSGGRVFGDELGVKRLEIGGVFVGEYDLFAGETVLEGVAAGPLLAGIGDRAGGRLGVAAVGF